jgi:hypothetical protein
VADVALAHWLRHVNCSPKPADKERQVEMNTPWMVTGWLTV